MQQLWTDAKIAGLIFQNANNLDPEARWMHEQIVTDMRDDYERALAFRNEDIGRLQGELKAATARIAELEAALLARSEDCDRLQGTVKVQMERIIELEAKAKDASLVQVDEDEDLFDPVNQAVISTMYSGTAFLLDCIDEPIHLPAGYCIAKVRQ